ncbi:MAG: HEPN domain-containing protein [Paludibacteraceae bacterium]|nr:HEPN domain-containing protein [Paludibacteraceae bacterium]
MLSAEDRKLIIEYRTEKAFKAFQESKDNASMGHWTLSANRLYYAAYYMASALLISRELMVKSHAGVILCIGRDFVQKGLLSGEDGRLLSNLQRMRLTGDYDDLFDWTEDDIKPLFEPTEMLLKKMQSLIQ